MNIHEHQAFFEKIGSLEFRSKNEERIAAALLLMNIPFTQEYSIPDGYAIPAKAWRFDFMIELKVPETDVPLKVLIEVDGEQHFYIPGCLFDPSVRANDIPKQIYALKSGYTLWRIHYKDCSIASGYSFFVNRFNEYLNKRSLVVYSRLEGYDHLITSSQAAVTELSRKHWTKDQLDLLAELKSHTDFCKKLELFTGLLQQLAGLMEQVNLSKKLTLLNGIFVLSREIFESLADQIVDSSTERFEITKQQTAENKEQTALCIQQTRETETMLIEAIRNRKQTGKNKKIREHFATILARGKKEDNISTVRPQESIEGKIDCLDRLLRSYREKEEVWKKDEREWKEEEDLWSIVSELRNQQQELEKLNRQEVITMRLFCPHKMQDTSGDNYYKFTPFMKENNFDGLSKWLDNVSLQITGLWKLCELRNDGLYINDLLRQEIGYRRQAISLLEQNKILLEQERQSALSTKPVNPFESVARLQGSFPPQAPNPFPSQAPNPFPSQAPNPFPSQTPNLFAQPQQTPNLFAQQNPNPFPITRYYY